MTALPSLSPRLRHGAYLTLTAAALLSAHMGCQGGQEQDEKVAKAMHLAESPREAPSQAWLGPPEKSLYERLEQLRELAEDEKQRGLFLHVDSFNGGYAAQRELARALARVRRAGKPVHCYFEGTDNAGYALLAGSCDRISMPESGLLDLTGVRAQAFFAGELLEKVGVTAELMQVGRFKGAAEALTANAMPDTTREALTRITEDLQQTLVATVTEGRKLPRDRVEEAMATGPLSAKAALDFGLVDAIGFSDESQEHLRRAAHVKKLEAITKAPDGPDFAALFHALSGDGHDTPDEPYVALVPMTGTIAMGGGPEGSSATTFVTAMKELRDDDNAAAVVLRIDSPGGSALASDLMWHAVYETRQVKPVFVSIGNMAASGGYYIASAAQHIVAEKTSLVGSIGVVGGKITVAGLAEKLGVHVETLRAAQNAGWSDPTTPLSETQRASLKTLLESTYTLFLKRITLGRGTDAAALEPMAEGRIHTATAAKEGGLVDELGGLFDTLELARSAAKLPRTSRVFVWEPSPRGLSEMLGGAVHTKSGGLSTLSDSLASAIDLPVVEVLSGSERVAASLPFGLDVK